MSKSDGRKPMTKEITVVRAGEEAPAPRQFGDGADVAEILEANDEELEKGESVAINGVTVKTDYVPLPDSTILIAPSTSGA